MKEWERKKKEEEKAKDKCIGKREKEWVRKVRVVKNEGEQGQGKGRREEERAKR